MGRKLKKVDVKNTEKSGGWEKQKKMEDKKKWEKNWRMGKKQKSGG